MSQVCESKKRKASRLALQSLGSGRSDCCRGCACAGRSRGTLLRHARQVEAGRATQAKRPPANQGRFSVGLPVSVRRLPHSPARWPLHHFSGLACRRRGRVICLAGAFGRWWPAVGKKCDDRSRMCGDAFLHRTVHRPTQLNQRPQGRADMGERIEQGELRWSPFGGQTGGLAKLGSGLRHAASSMPAGAVWTSAGVRPPKAV
jgi:hypothetical protein